jgi:Tfp pilus assembly protein PilN
MYQQINLYQPIFRKQRQIFSAVALLYGVGIIAGALLGIYVYGWWQVTGLEAEVVQLEGREKAFAAQLTRIDPSLNVHRRAEVEQELERLSATLLEQQRLIEVLRDEPLGSNTGFSGYLAALGRQRTPELWLTEFAINGSSGALELAGRSTRPELVPAYLQRLGTEAALAGQRFDRLEIEDDAERGETVFRATSRAAATRTERAGVADTRLRP